MSNEQKLQAMNAAGVAALPALPHIEVDALGRLRLRYETPNVLAIYEAMENARRLLGDVGLFPHELDGLAYARLRVAAKGLGFESVEQMFDTLAAKVPKRRKGAADS